MNIREKLIEAANRHNPNAEQKYTDEDINVLFGPESWRALENLLQASLASIPTHILEVKFGPDDTRGQPELKESGPQVEYVGAGAWRFWRYKNCVVGSLHPGYEDGGAGSFLIWWHSPEKDTSEPQPKGYVDQD